MICPHCGVGVKFAFHKNHISFVFEDEESDAIDQKIYAAQCPECEEIIIQLITKYWDDTSEEIIAYPLNNARRVDKTVPKSYKNDFLEACNVLPISPKASAALSRRILQQILHDEYKIVCKNLVEEITDFLKNPNIPSYVKDTVDAVRHFGNFAAHPTKDTITGEIIDVEAGEAEWLIEVLEALFDITFVQPKRLEEKQKQLNAKLKKAGKSPMKTS